MREYSCIRDWQLLCRCRYVGACALPVPLQNLVSIFHALHFHRKA